MTLQEIKEKTHACSCEACAHGCKHGSGAMAEEDVPALAQHLGISEEELKKSYLEEIEKYGTKRFRPKQQRKKGFPHGACIFYDKKKGCTVHEAKPLECSIAMGCKPYGPALVQWFHAHYFVRPADEESLGAWSWVEKTHGTIPGASVKELREQIRTNKNDVRTTQRNDTTKHN